MVGAGVVAVSLLVVSMMTAVRDDDIQEENCAGCDDGSDYLYFLTECDDE